MTGFVALCLNMWYPEVPPKICESYHVPNRKYPLFPKAQHEASSLKDDMRMQAEPDFQAVKSGSLKKKMRLIVVNNDSCCG